MKTVEALADRTAVPAKSARTGMDETDKAGDADAADILSALSRPPGKSLWLLEAAAAGVRYQAYLPGRSTVASDTQANTA